MEVLLFVYGTLLKGEPNHHLLGGAQLIAEQASILGKLYDTGCGYPALVAGGAEAQAVYGELYAIPIPMLSALDELEDYYGPGDPRNLYERVQVQVRLGHTVETAYTYVFTPESAVSCTLILVNDWRAYQRPGT